MNFWIMFRIASSLQQSFGLCGSVANPPDSTSFPMFMIFFDLTVISQFFSKSRKRILSYEHQRSGQLLTKVVCSAYVKRARTSKGAHGNKQVSVLLENVTFVNREIKSRQL